MYRDSYYLNDNQSKHYTNINLINFRQSLIDKICHQNDLIEMYKKKLNSQLEINCFLQKIYFYINFNL